ncbi:hypothetical protein TWF225_010220 [Orbilia oligospora]|uniref:Ribosomal protein L5 C-terminal domain-containing protein n=1 Tax=Orbilia oligospora TaxID=2813651 RepID=A0A7C8N6Y2_ORBOL|nr:hypothetical protein TWF706_011358 [Orbilia oligospora]KAF3096106.1 hypothetical protein TWF102_006734 [Orbilia oligospora]KAF3117147.1 hypothetical protein TWF103_007300 [Orbilia oligospora]KAF3178349.1 hypothetical protein TWF751_001387 [Orbilia oligospora]KAF3193476.1 hypothetical protein TWF225_010220 [Orbilia oligospora]
MASITPKMLPMNCARYIKSLDSTFLQRSRPSIAAINAFLFPTSSSSTPTSSNRSFTTTTPLQKRDPAGHRRFGRVGRHQVRHPRYYRGPYHPHQPPKPSDPSSREFVPGPFTSERLWDHYNDTIAADLMTMAYTHSAPHAVEKPQKDRLRKWEGDSPYFENRPRRGPRGKDYLPLTHRPITFRNVPRLEEVVLHCFSDASTLNPLAIRVAIMAAQSITGSKANLHVAKATVAAWKLKKDQQIAVTCRMSGPSMYRFLATCIDVVMPRIKEYKGVKGTTGDRSGNLTFGFDPEVVAQFPEIEVNYDMYPAKMIPGCHITCKTTATSDRDARMLLTAFGVPFYGKIKTY